MFVYTRRSLTDGRAPDSNKIEGVVAVANGNAHDQYEVTPYEAHRHSSLQDWNGAGSGPRLHRMFCFRNVLITTSSLLHPKTLFTQQFYLWELVFHVSKIHLPTQNLLQLVRSSPRGCERVRSSSRSCSRDPSGSIRAAIIAPGER